MLKSSIARLVFVSGSLALSMLAMGCAASSSSSGGSQTPNTSANGSALYKELAVPSGSTRACPIGKTQMVCAVARSMDGTNDIKISLQKSRTGTMFHFGEAKYVADGKVQGLKNPNGVEAEYSVVCKGQSLLLTIKSPNSPNALQFAVTRVSKNRYSAEIQVASTTGDSALQMVCR